MEKATQPNRGRWLAATNVLWWLLYGASRLVSLISNHYCRLHVYVLVAQPVDFARFSRFPRRRSLDIREIGAEEAMALPVPRPREALARRFRQGARCLVARRDGNFQGFLWYQHRAYEEDEVRCCFIPAPPERAVWDFDVFVVPSARGSLTFGRLWQSYYEAISSQGIEWSISRISAFNVHSIAAHAKLGAVRVGTAGFFTVGAVQLMLATVAPFVHFSAGAHQRPVVKVQAPLAN